MSHSRKKNPYRKSRRFDKTCRCNGGCPYCLSDRKHAERKRIMSSKEQMKNHL